MSVGKVAVSKILGGFAPGPELNSALLEATKKLAEVIKNDPSLSDDVFINYRDFLKRHWVEKDEIVRWSIHLLREMAPETLGNTFTFTKEDDARTWREISLKLEVDPNALLILKWKDATVQLQPALLRVLLAKKNISLPIRIVFPEKRHTWFFEGHPYQLTGIEAELLKDTCDYFRVRLQGEFEKAYQPLNFEEYQMILNHLLYPEKPRTTEELNGLLELACRLDFVSLEASCLSKLGKST